MTRRVIRIGTRASALALAQAHLVATALSAATGVEAQLVRISTRGDVDRAPLTRIGGTGVFVTAVRAALVDGRIDLAVHSFKDLPTADAPGIALAAVPAREDPADVLCAAGHSDLRGLPAGARVGTGSPRRAAQLLRLRPDLTVTPVRGNVDTRLGLVADGTLDAVLLARAGLARLGRLDAITQVFGPDEMLPAPAQGALAVECRSADVADQDLAAVIAALDDGDTRCAATAERSLLAELEAGCSAPVGALATLEAGRLTLRAAVMAPSGSPYLAGAVTGVQDAAATLGIELAQHLLRRGAADLLGRP